MNNNLTLTKTEDFTIFKFLEDNRTLNKAQVNKLVKTLKVNPTFTYQSPIVVNEKLEIIDGQHRLTAHKVYAEKEGVVTPIYYLIRNGLTIEDAKAINSGTKPWKPEDYAKAYSKQNKAYDIYLKCLGQRDLNHDILMRYLAPSDYSLESFREGRFVVEDLNLSNSWFESLEEVGEILEAERIADRNYWQNRSFAIALLNLMRSEDYEQDRMIEQIEKHGKLLRTTLMKNKDLEQTLKKIYNKGTTNKVSFN